MLDRPVNPPAFFAENRVRTSAAGGWAAPALGGSFATFAAPAIAADIRETPSPLPSIPTRLHAIPIDPRATAADIREIGIPFQANAAASRETAIA